MYTVWITLYLEQINHVTQVLPPNPIEDSILAGLLPNIDCRSGCEYYYSTCSLSASLFLISIGSASAIADKFQNYNTLPMQKSSKSAINTTQVADALVTTRLVPV